jgi:hypothetical protein
MLGKLLAARTVERHNPLRFAQFERGDLLLQAKQSHAARLQLLDDGQELGEGAAQPI